MTTPDRKESTTPQPERQIEIDGHIFRIESPTFTEMYEILYSNGLHGAVSREVEKERAEREIRSSDGYIYGFRGFTKIEGAISSRGHDGKGGQALSFNEYKPMTYFDGVVETRREVLSDYTRSEKERDRILKQMDLFRTDQIIHLQRAKLVQRADTRPFYPGDVVLTPGHSDPVEWLTDKNQTRERSTSQS